MLRRTLLILSLSVLCLLTSSTEAAAAKKLRILFITQSKGFTHGAVKRPKDTLAPSEIAMTQLGQQTGLFSVDCTQNVEADFTKDNLKNYDIVMFYTTGVLPISDEARDYFVNDWLKQKGHGVIGFHSATDTYRTKDPGHQWYWDIMGGSFNGHPWTAGMTSVFTVHDPKFPSMKPFGNEFEFKDEIYQYYNFNPQNVKVLISINMEKSKLKKPYHVPVAWVRTWGQGRVHYNNLGHNNGTWTNKTFLKSTETAIRWTAGLIDGDATPNPEVSAKEEAKAKAAVR